LASAIISFRASDRRMELIIFEPLEDWLCMIISFVGTRWSQGL